MIGTKFVNTASLWIIDSQGHLVFQQLWFLKVNLVSNMVENRVNLYVAAQTAVYRSFLMLVTHSKVHFTGFNPILK